MSNEADAVTRIDLPARLPAAEVVAEPHPVSPGERLLTQMAESLLARGGQGGPATENLGEIVTALIEVDALPPGSPASGQLAALCECLGRGDHGITAVLPDVPQPWADVLGLNEGKGWRLVQPAGLLGRVPPATQTAAAAAAVALPEIDGVRFAVAGLHSGWNRNVLYVVATGLPPLSPGVPGSRRPDTGFSWWLRDTAGRWHLAVYGGSEARLSGESRLSMSIVPPLGPETGEIELVVTGRSARVRARLPLRWHILGQ